MCIRDRGERLRLSGQAVSKWERGECLPDTGLLLDLAEVLETNADSLLRGGEPVLTFAGRIRVEDILQGMEGFFAFPRLVGKNNTLYPVSYTHLSAFVYNSSIAILHGRSMLILRKILYILSFSVNFINLHYLINKI